MGNHLTTTHSLALPTQLLDTLRHDLHDDKWTPGPLPKQITDELKHKARASLIKLERHLEPARSEDIAGHIFLLLGHYYVDNKLPREVQEGMALQWLKVLEQYPEWAVEAAAIEYLDYDKEGRKPKPGQIADLCRRAVAKYRVLQVQCERIIRAPNTDPDADRPPTEAEKQAVSEIMADIRKGLAGKKEVLTAGQEKNELYDAE